MKEVYSVSIYSMSDDKMAKAAALARSGKSLHQIAAEMRISVEMARSAASKWPVIERMKQFRSL